MLPDSAECILSSMAIILSWCPVFGLISERLFAVFIHFSESPVYCFLLKHNTIYSWLEKRASSDLRYTIITQNVCDKAEQHICFLHTTKITFGTQTNTLINSDMSGLWACLCVTGHCETTWYVWVYWTAMGMGSSPEKKTCYEGFLFGCIRSSDRNTETLNELQAIGRKVKITL